MYIFRGVELGPKVKVYYLSTMGLSIILPIIIYSLARSGINFTNPIIAAATVFHIVWFVKMRNVSEIRHIKKSNAIGMAVLSLLIIIPLIINLHTVVSDNRSKIQGLLASSIGG